MTKTIITIEKNVSCLPGYESFDTTSIARRMPKRARLKSVTELRFEKEKREGKINLLRNAG